MKEISIFEELMRMSMFKKPNQRVREEEKTPRSPTTPKIMASMASLVSPKNTTQVTGVNFNSIPDENED